MVMDDSIRHDFEKLVTTPSPAPSIRRAALHAQMQPALRLAHTVR